MPRFLKAAVLLLVTCLSTALVAQDNVMDDVNQEVTRVIQLRSAVIPQAPAEVVEKAVADSRQVAEETTSRTRRAMKQVADPLDIRYDQVKEEVVPAQRAPMSATPRVAQTPQYIQQPTTAPIWQQQQQPVLGQQSIMAQPAMPYAAAANVVKTSSPQVIAEIVSPKFINLKQVAKLRINVKNVGTTGVQNVSLIARLPDHVSFSSSTPKPTASEGSLHEFVLSDLGPRQQSQVLLEVVPNEKRPINVETLLSIASRQQTAVGVREPVLQVRVEGNPQVNVGQWVDHVVTVENTGDGLATNVKLETEFPGELKKANQSMPTGVGSLAPGQSAKFMVRSYAEGSGELDLRFVVASQGTRSQQAKTQLRVMQPELHVAAFGPNVNFVNRGGIYTIKVKNPGEVAVENVEIAMSVPAGMKVTTVNRQAKTGKDGNTLGWRFESMPAKTEETIQLKAVATSIGEQTCVITVRSKQTMAKDFHLTTVVASRPDVSINISNDGGPSQVGSPTNFKIAVKNNGSSNASNVQVHVELPADLMPVDKGQYSISQHTNTISFTPLEIEAGGEQELVFSTVGINQGEHVVRSVLQMDGSQRRLIAEDSVFVFESDESKVGEALPPALKRR